jgi:hypothetical protein
MHLLLAPEHAAREHLELDVALRRGLEPSAHVLDGDDGRVTGGVHVGSLHHGLRPHGSGGESQRGSRHGGMPEHGSAGGQVGFAWFG